MTFLTELKQRKVFQIAIGYLAVAWLVVQVAATLFPVFHAPEWAMRITVLLFAMGFPVALLLAWALEWTPEGIRLDTRKSGGKFMFAMAASLVVLTLGWYFRDHLQPQTQGTGTAAKIESKAPERSIAVLPFVNMSGDPANEYFSDGIAETTLDMLAQVADLKVIARTSAFAFKGRAMDMREIGRALGVAHLLEGSVQQAGDTVRITAQLIRTADGSHLWSHRFDRKRTDIFAIQDEIAAEVVKALQVAMPAARRKQISDNSRAANITAYDEYLRGNGLLQQGDLEEVQEALKHFERALQLDDSYARAHIGAAKAIESMGNLWASTPELDNQRREHVSSAMDLDKNLGEALVADAELMTGQDLRDRDSSYLRGIALAPSDADSYLAYGNFLFYEKHDAETAIIHIRRAAELNPLSPRIQVGYARALFASGHIEQADAVLAKVLAREPKSALVNDSLADLHAMSGDLVGALRFGAEAKIDSPASSKRLDFLDCTTLVVFGAFAEGESCLGSKHGHDADAGMTQYARSFFDFYRGDYAQSRKGAKRCNCDPHPETFIFTGDPRRALVEIGKLSPDLLREPLGKKNILELNHVAWAAEALLHTGEREQAEALLRRGLAVAETRPYYYGYGRGWNVVFFHALLGEPEQACAEMARALQAGWVIFYPQLEVNPSLAMLRQHTCYAPRIAAIRAKAQAEVEKARKAGLLDFSASK